MPWEPNGFLAASSPQEKWGQGRGGWKQGEEVIHGSGEPCSDQRLPSLKASALLISSLILGLLLKLHPLQDHLFSSEQ